MKKFIGFLTIFALFFSKGVIAQEDSCVPEDAEVFYSDEDTDVFNRGKFVGTDGDDFLRKENRIRNKNWALAIGTSIIGIATLILVGTNHKK